MPHPLQADVSRAHTCASFASAQIYASFPHEIAARISEGFDAAPSRPCTLRANTLKASASEVANMLQRADISYRGVPWYEDAFVLADTCTLAQVRALSLYEQGNIYVQSLSSMIPALVLAPQDESDILDMCAAPGGKTSQLAALAPRAHISACELHVPRAEKLAYNLRKLGIQTVSTLRLDARRLDPLFSFDQILLDAPCTGTGTLAAHSDRQTRRITPALMEKVTRSQAALLDRGLSVLKAGGTLVYSTCSILPQENEEQIERALDNKHHHDCTLEAIELDATWQEGCFALPLLPSSIPGTLLLAPNRFFEGFFVAKIRKNPS